MDEAAEALENGDIAGALDRQSDAMESMREGMTAPSAGRWPRDEGREPGQGQAEGAMPQRPAARRPRSGAGRQFRLLRIGRKRRIPRRGLHGSARELLDELRRRSADQDRPEVELEYLRRLLDQF